MENKLYGLSEEEARQSLEKYGKNEFTKKQSVSFLKKFVRSFSDPIIKILLFALGVTLILPGNGGFESVGIAVSIVVSTFVSTLSDYESEKAFRRMQSEAEKETCTVIRGERRKTIPVTGVAVGDLVCLRAGDKIPADGIIIYGGISCDQSALNGESKEKQKNAASGAFSEELNNTSSVFRGSTVTAGDAVMKVCYVGDNSYYGKMASELQSENEESPLKKKLSGLAGTLSKFGYICAVCVAAAELIYSFFIDKSFVPNLYSVTLELIHALTLAVSVVVVAVPEGLPMMITVVLSSNMVKMQRHSVRVRRAVGIETAGSVNILFTDKTGTLTCGKPKTSCYVFGDGKRASRASDIPEKLRTLVGGCALSASDCVISGRIGKRNYKAEGGNGTDRAIIDGFLASAKYPKELKRTALLPFDSSRKLSASHVILSAKKGELTFVKGAPEMLLSNCKSCYLPDGSTAQIDTEALRKELDAMMSKGMRVVAMASSAASGEAVEKMSQLSRGNQAVDTSALFADMTFICFVGVRDELRREAPKAVRELKDAGISVVMITGDSALTATAIAKDAGILEEDGGVVLESSELSAISDERLCEILPSLRVVARAMPQDKSRLVRVAKSLGLVTAMTGDGLNDSPALKQADVGFAMGSGTEVAKEAGDIIISDDNISSIVRAVLYGRTIFRSIRKFVVFQLTMNLSAVGISLIGPFIGFESPVTVVQMLWINLIMDTLAALAFAGEAPMARYLKEKPLPISEAVLNGSMMMQIFIMGVYTVMLCLYFLQSQRINGIFGTEELLLSGFFALFVFCGIFGSLNARAGRFNILSGLLINPVFLLVMSAVFTSQLFMIYYGGSVFRCVPLSAEQLKTVIAIALSVIPVGMIVGVISRAGGKSK